MQFGDSVTRFSRVGAASRPFVKKTFTLECRFGPQGTLGLDFLFSGSSTLSFRGLWDSGYC